jgi:type II secretory pathway pseudopilin PulG
MKTRKAFTLVELLVVIGILFVLVSLLLAGVSAAKEKARRVVALTEIKQLETALKCYYQEYQSWPVPAGYNETDPWPVTSDLASILQGTKSGTFNINKLQFMEFNKLVNGIPVNPWGTQYFCKFDSTFDNAINKGRGTEPPQPQAARHPVIVWTMTKAGTIVQSW